MTIRARTSRSLPFGQPNAYRVGLSFSQLVWSGGRVAAQESQARLGHANATISLGSTKAQLALDVAQAFYDAALADRLVPSPRSPTRRPIARRSRAVAARSRPRVGVRAAARAGRRATRCSRRSCAARATRDVAYLRLKQLLDLPLDAPVQLAAALDDAELPPAARFQQPLAEAEAGDRRRGRARPSPRRRTRCSLQRGGADGRRVAAQAGLSLNSIFGLVTYPTAVPTSTTGARTGPSAPPCRCRS